jgi:hypothetical protein
MTEASEFLQEAVVRAIEDEPIPTLAQALIERLEVDESEGNVVEILGALRAALVEGVRLGATEAIAFLIADGRLARRGIHLMPEINIVVPPWPAEQPEEEPT